MGATTIAPSSQPSTWGATISPIPSATSDSYTIHLSRNCPYSRHNTTITKKNKVEARSRPCCCRKNGFSKIGLVSSIKHSTSRTTIYAFKLFRGEGILGLMGRDGAEVVRLHPSSHITSRTIGQPPHRRSGSRRCWCRVRHDPSRHQPDWCRMRHDLGLVVAGKMDFQKLACFQAKSTLLAALPFMLLNSI